MGTRNAIAAFMDPFRRRIAAEALQKTATWESCSSALRRTSVSKQSVQRHHRRKRFPGLGIANEDRVRLLVECLLQCSLYQVVDGLKLGASAARAGGDFGRFENGTALPAMPCQALRSYHRQAASADGHPRDSRVSPGFRLTPRLGPPSRSRSIASRLAPSAAVAPRRQQQFPPDAVVNIEAWDSFRRASSSESAGCAARSVRARRFRKGSRNLLKNRSSLLPRKVHGAARRPAPGAFSGPGHLGRRTRCPRRS